MIKILIINYYLKNISFFELINGYYYSSICIFIKYIIKQSKNNIIHILMVIENLIWFKKY